MLAAGGGAPSGPTGGSAACVATLGGSAGAAGGDGGVASSVAAGARSMGCSPDSAGPSRYGFGSPCSAAGRVVRGPRPRRGGRRRSFMQVLSVRVNARETRVGVLASSSVRRLQSRRRGGTLFRGNARRRASLADRSMMDIERREWCGVPRCLPTRIPHAGSGNGPTRGAALGLASCTPVNGDTGRAAHRCSVGRRGALSDRRTQRVWPTPSIRATHSRWLRTSCRALGRELRRLTRLSPRPRPRAWCAALRAGASRSAARCTPG